MPARNLSNFLYTLLRPNDASYYWERICAMEQDEGIECANYAGGYSLKLYRFAERDSRAEGRYKSQIAKLAKANCREYHVFRNEKVGVIVVKRKPRTRFP